MPNAPNGTKPISTVRWDSRSHNSEPMPVPIENMPMASKYKSPPPPRLALAYTSSCAVNAVPKNQNQEMPSAELKTARCFMHSRITRQLSVNGFQLIFRCGDVGGANGIACAAP